MHQEAPSKKTGYIIQLKRMISSWSYMPCIGIHTLMELDYLVFLRTPLLCMLKYTRSTTTYLPSTKTMIRLEFWWAFSKFFIGGCILTIIYIGLENPFLVWCGYGGPPNYYNEEASCGQPGLPGQPLLFGMELLLSILPGQPPLKLQKF